MSRLSCLTLPVFSRLPLLMFFIAIVLLSQAISVSGLVLFNNEVNESARLGWGWTLTERQ